MIYVRGLQAPVRRIGLGNFALSDVLQLPGGQGAWSQIQQQISADGDTAEGTVAQNMVVAQNDFLDAINQISNAQPDIDTSQLVPAGLGYVINNRTIGGAINNVEGLVSAVESGVPSAIVQSVTGLITSSVTVLVAGAVISTGVGAAIIAGIGILDAAISFFTHAPAGEAICGGTVNPPPNYLVGCAFNTNGQTTQLGPTNPDWRKFPVPSNPNDAWWFQAVPTTSIPYSITTTAGNWTAGRSTDQWGAVLGAGTRPIDAAFSVYHELECEIASAKQTIGWGAGAIGPDAVMYAQFQLAFIAAWKSNQEYALNGLKAQPDWLVLLHTARLWNRAHAPGQGVNITASSTTSDPSNVIEPLASCSSVVGDYESLLINGVISGAGSTSNTSIWADVITNSGTTVHINTGASKRAAGVLASSASASSTPITGATIATVGAVTGAAIVSTAFYAYLTHQTVGTLAKSWFNRAKREIGL